MKEELSTKDNYILDGYPRTLKQDKFMQDFCVPDMIVDLSISAEEVLHRAVGRRVCANCGEIYNLNGFKLPKNEGVCDKCGGKLLHREDDKEKAVKKRYYEYIEKTYPIINKYKYGDSDDVLVWEFDVTQHSSEKIAEAVAGYINYIMH